MIEAKDEFLLLDLIEGYLDAAAFDAMQARLAEEPDLLSRYGELCLLDAALHEMFPGPAAGITGRREGARPNRQGRRGRRMTLVAVAAAGLAAMLAMTVIRPGSTEAPKSREVVEAAVAELEFSPIVEVEVDRDGERVGGLKPPSKLSPGDEVSLKRGSMAVRLQEGSVVALVEAPARIRMDSGSRLRMDEGRMSIDVGEGAQGLVCETGVWTIRDRGTRFGVHAENGELGEVVVYEGEVELGSRERDDQYLLGVGEGLRIDGRGELKIESAEFSRYPENLPTREIVLEWSAAGLDSPRWVDELTGGPVRKEGAGVRFGGPEGRVEAMLNLPTELPTATGEVVVLEMDWNIETPDSGRAGVVLLDGDSRRIFVGRDSSRSGGWVCRLASEFGDLENGTSIQFDPGPDPAAIRISYHRGNGVVRIEAKDEGVWSPIVSTIFSDGEEFDRLCLVAQGARMTVESLEVACEK